MSETLIGPAPAAAASVPGSAPPGAAPPGDAANAFLAALLASGLATAPPPGLATSVRTAVAEDAPAGGDSSGKDSQTTTLDASLLALAAATPPVQLTPPPVAAPRIAPQPMPVQTGPVNAAGPQEAPAAPALQLAPASQQPIAAGPVAEIDPQAPEAPIVKAPPELPAAAAPPQQPGPVVDPGPASGPPQTGVDRHRNDGHHTPDGARPVADAPVALAHGPQADSGQTPGQGTPHDQRPTHTRADTPPVAAAPVTDTPPVQAAAAPPVQPGRVVDAAPSAAAPAQPVRLHDLPEAFRTAVRVAVHEGNTTARIQLSPQHLGNVDIRLQYDTTGGVTAQVTAESPAAAATLSAQLPELRRALEAQGLNVLGLDIQQSGVGAGSTPDKGPGFGRQAHHNHHGSFADDSTDTTTIDVTSLPLAAGQVNVLA